MKLLLPVVIVALSFCIGAEASDFKDRFPTELRKTFVGEINAICAEGWCGDRYQIVFSQLNCPELSAPTCLASFAYWRKDKPNYKISGSCALDDIFTIDDLLDGRSEYLTLTDSAYEELSDCLSRF